MASAFSGNPHTEWLVSSSDHDRKMQLIDAFSYTDWNGKTWSVPAKYVVDGASIPRALWTAVGSPYCGMYRRASVVHDKACDEAKGDPTARKAADRMFYQACRDGGCGKFQATILYAGVRIGANWRAAGLLVDEVPAEPRIEETQEDFDVQVMLKKIVTDPEVASAPDDAEWLEKAVDHAAKRYLATLPAAGETRALVWQ